LAAAFLLSRGALAEAPFTRRRSAVFGLTRADAGVLSRPFGAGRIPAVVFRFDRALGGMVRLTPASYRRAIVGLFRAVCRRVCR
jgi:hypothetical protein